MDNPSWSTQPYYQMDTNKKPSTSKWPLWRKIVFRFLFIFFAFFMAPWPWLDSIPGVKFVAKYWDKLTNWIVHLFNAKLFHVKDVLVPPAGSGDTSYGWAELWTYLLLAAVGCVVWSALDRKRANYTHLNYWLCQFARYFVAYVAFVYGIEKVFAVQMVFPSLHQLATPLGDLLPMRFSWLFIGYSTPYQIFSGIMEVFVGVLLLWRRTASLGAFVATGVFINVVMLNLCYDIPVKIFSIEMAFACLFLLANESERFICFFVLNKPANPCSIYHFEYKKKWMRISRIVLKVVFILVAVGYHAFTNWGYRKQEHETAKKQAIENGLYVVANYSVGNRNTPLALTDTLRWQDIVLEDGRGSIRTSDTTFRQRYSRAYFSYTIDSVKRTIAFRRRMPNDSLVALVDMRYSRPDKNTIKLWGTHGTDSVFLELKKSNHIFHLADRQFHWLNEQVR